MSWMPIRTPGVLEDARRVLETESDQAAAPARATTCRRSSRRAASRPPSSTARCRRASRPCPTGRPSGCSRSLLHASQRALAARCAAGGSGLAAACATRHPGAEPILEAARRCGRRRSCGRTGTQGARRRVRRMERRGRSGFRRRGASARERRVRAGLLGRPRAVLRLPVHAPADRDRRRRQADAARGRRRRSCKPVEADAEHPAVAAHRRRAGARLAGVRERVRRCRAPRGHHGLRRARLDDVGCAAHPPDLGLRRQRQRAGPHDARPGAEHVRGSGRDPQRALARGGCRRHPVREPVGERAALRRRPHAVAEGDARAARPARGPHRRAGRRAASSRPSPPRGRPRSTRPRPTTRR